jgi:electron transport complex protein RnfE
MRSSTVSAWGSGSRRWSSSAHRELLGSGAILGYTLTPEKPLLFFALPAGGFFSIALLMALFNFIERKMTGGAAKSASGGGAHG